MNANRIARDASEFNPSATAPATFDPGETIAIFKRGDDARLRLALKTYLGKPFADLRQEWRGEDGTWRPTRKGTSIKLRELRDLRDALDRALARLPDDGSRR